MAVGHDPEDQGEPCETAFRSFTRAISLLEARWVPQMPFTHTALKMTLCGSEVPQDRWRGRTAGSGMWTLTRDNLLSWSLDDPAITYG